MKNKFTKMYDESGYKIYVGDQLKNEHGYSIIVCRDEYGEYYGELICNDKHPCKNIPYALNKGKGYTKTTQNK